MLLRCDSRTRLICVVKMLPKDPVMLLSVVNTKLRDEYGSLEELCAALNVEESALRSALAGLDYSYDPVHNQFK